MKLRLLQILSLVYIILIFILTKNFSIVPLIFFIIVLLIDNFTRLRAGIKNLLYLLSALSSFMPLFGLFVLYLPFAIFGLLLPARNFIKNYVVGFAISYVPFNIIYILPTYLNIRLNLPIILLIYLILPLIAFIILKNKSLESLELKDREGILLFIILFATTIIAIGIVDNEHVFMSNSAREYSRMQYALDGLINFGSIPIYNPGIAQGEATFLFDAPSRASQFIVENFILRFIPKILFFNIHSFFILFMSTLALSVLYSSISNRKNSMLDALAISAVTVLVGLNFYFVQILESIKQSTAFPLAYLLLSIIFDNPESFNEFLIMAYLVVTIMPIHSAYGLGVIILAAFIFIFKKRYYLKNLDEAKQFIKWTATNKLLIFVTLPIIASLSLYYIAGGVIYKDFLKSKESNFNPPTIKEIKDGIVQYFKDFFQDDWKLISLRFPDVNRPDDHVSGFFVSIFGISALVILLLLYKLKGLENFRIYVIGYVLYLFVMAMIHRYGIMFGGLFRTNKPYLLILLGTSILTFIFLFSNKIVKLAFIAIVFIGFVHAMPHINSNIINVHREKFMSGGVYKDELDFVKKLDIDGRIMTYGLFNNVVDFGSNQMTGRYFSREEREELLYHSRNIYYKVHSPHSFGQEAYVLNKSGREISNYLRLGGYRYVFSNVCHPVGRFIANSLYPSYSYPIYQNQCMVFLVINKTSYTEKIDLVENLSEEEYAREDGYKYDSIRKDYKHGMPVRFTEIPKEPIPLEFKRLSTTKVKIFGDFDEGEWVLFKERFWPRWKAYIEGKEVPVLPDSHEQILIMTIKGKDILLEYSVLTKEKIFGLVSFLGFLGFFILVLFVLKKTISY